MKLGINLLLYKESSGIEFYARNLLENFGRLNKEDEFFIFTNRKTPEQLIFNYKNFHYIKTPIDSREKIKRVLWEQTIFPFCLKKYKIDVLFNLTVSGPQFWPGKKITTIHDCAYDRFKESRFLSSRIYFKFMFYGAAKFSSKIITVSNFSKKEIMDLYRVPGGKIKIIYEGAPEESTQTLPSETEAEKTLKKFKIKPSFFLYVGSIRPRKNITGLLKAFKIFGQKRKDIDLVLAGERTPRFLNIKKTIRELNLEKKIIQTGFVEKKEKAALYKSSLALVFPSFYEGFGLPVLEAQSFGVPVLTSDVSSLPEVAGSAALYVNPYDVRDIAKGMEKIASDKSLRQNLIKKGFKNVKRFSWGKTAKETLEVLKGEVK